MFAQMKSRRHDNEDDEDEIAIESGYRDNALEPVILEPRSLGFSRIGAHIVIIVMRLSAKEWGPWKRLGQLFLVVLPFVWPAALVPWWGWQAFAISGMMLLAWLIPSMAVVMTVPEKTPVIQILLRFSWWPLYAIAKLYRWVRDGQ